MAGLVGAGLLATAQTPLHAADHKDGPAALANPATDITDVYSWMSSDHTKINLVMDVFPGADATSKFSDTALYVFHTSAAPMWSGGAMPPTQADNVICQFDAGQKISCWLGSEYVTGDASAAAGITSADGKVRVFAGLRDDPFFFNISGFKDAVAAVEMAAPGLMFDANGCPQLNAATSMALVNMLSHQMNGTAPAADDFGKPAPGLRNILSIVVQVDASLVSSPTSPIVGVWGSTNMAM